MEDDWDSHDNFLKEGNTEVCYSGLFFIFQNNLALACNGVLENSGAKKIFFKSNSISNTDIACQLQ